MSFLFLEGGTFGPSETWSPHLWSHFSSPGRSHWENPVNKFISWINPFSEEALQSWVESNQNLYKVSWYDSNDVESYPGLQMTLQIVNGVKQNMSPSLVWCVKQNVPVKAGHCTGVLARLPHSSSKLIGLLSDRLTKHILTKCNFSYNRPHNAVCNVNHGPQFNFHFTSYQLWSSLGWGNLGVFSTFRVYEKFTLKAATK